MSATIDRSLEEKFQKDIDRSTWFTKGFTAGYLSRTKDIAKAYKKGYKEGFHAYEEKARKIINKNI